jgi:hypothetical protein
MSSFLGFTLGTLMSLGATGAGFVPGDIAALSTRVGDRTVRVWVGTRTYELHPARIEPDGIGFAAPDILDLSPPARAAGAERLPPVSPIAWDRIDGVAVAEVSPGRVAALSLGVAGLCALAIAPTAGHMRIGTIFLIPVIGAVAGAIIGAQIPRWETVWESGAGPGR